MKLRFIRKKFKAQEVQNPTRKKPQEVENVNANLFNRKIYTFFKWNVRKQTFNVKGNHKISFGGKLVDFLNKRKRVTGVVLSWDMRI